MLAFVSLRRRGLWALDLVGRLQHQYRIAIADMLCGASGCPAKTLDERFHRAASRASISSSIAARIPSMPGYFCAMKEAKARTASRCEGATVAWISPSLHACS